MSCYGPYIYVGSGLCLNVCKLCFWSQNGKILNLALPSVVIIIPSLAALAGLVLLSICCLKPGCPCYCCCGRCKRREHEHYDTSAHYTTHYVDQMPLGMQKVYFCSLCNQPTNSHVCHYCGGEAKADAFGPVQMATPSPQAAPPVPTAPPVAPSYAASSPMYNFNYANTNPQGYGEPAVSPPTTGAPPH
jgi:hypothetical protein